MTVAGLGLALLVVVAWISFRERRVIYPLAAIGLGICIAASSGAIGGVDGLVTGSLPNWFNDLADAIFR